jgi:hypothetical protein
VTLDAFSGLVWFLISLLPFLFVQRRLQRELQAVLLLLTRSPAMTVGIFSLLFFPGVLLHELSHFLMARLLRVQTGKFSLLPEMQADGKLRLGFVETEQTDFFRDALIGAAPLITGMIATALIGLQFLGVDAVLVPAATGRWQAVWPVLAVLPAHSDFWVWFYLVFAISSSMVPSPSDRRGWLPLLGVLAIITILVVVAGAGPWMMANLTPWLNTVLGSLAVVFFISLGVHVILILPVLLLRVVLSAVMHVKVV